MDTTTVRAAQTASESMQNTGIAAAGGALFLKLGEMAMRLVPALNEGKKLDKKLTDHKELCTAELNGRFDVLENRLQNGNARFQTIEDRAREDREAAAARHEQVVNLLMEIRSK